MRSKIQILKHKECNYRSNYKFKNKLIFDKKKREQKLDIKNKNLNLNRK